LFFDSSLRNAKPSGGIKLEISTHFQRCVTQCNFQALNFIHCAPVSALVQLGKMKVLNRIVRAKDGRMNTINHWINNAYTEGGETTVERVEVTNPATGVVSGQVAMASHATVDEAVAAAIAAFPAWRDTSLSKRAQIL